MLATDIQGLKLMEGIWNLRWGRTKALSEMGKTRKYRELRITRIIEVGGGGVIKKEEREEEKERKHWWHCLYCHWGIL